ncbi:cytochrome-c oxidase, cbb3-type subunit III [Tsuneonella mangrovi]|uniref:cytochrome-c oxidase, cbb3-type subunit III n=1 Tax=Tsuneonella mangrovi TaxID=1982042 RepID=UPI000BA1E100|nr:cytochrome-c oxidase, cbb3-type subunit III [Tsuneonella mangrovi]
MANKHVDQLTGTQTVGHEWDGIEELDTPLPRWWLWTFYLTIVFAIGYVIAYPALPMLNRATEGELGWTSRGQLAKDMKAAEQSRTALREQLAQIPIEQLPDHPDLMQQAVAGGAAAFKVNCVQCHGSGGGGVVGHYPNLNDDDWLWGGDLKAIQTTITHGIRQPGDDATRNSAMPPFEGMFTAAELDALAQHVQALSHKAPDSAAGAKLFAENCAICHGANGGGDRQVGAPRLNDAIWLYGGSRAAIEKQVVKPHMGVMPAWDKKLDPVTIKMLAAYVHSLGGGEDFAPEQQQPAATVDDVQQ